MRKLRRFVTFPPSRPRVEQEVQSMIQVTLTKSLIGAKPNQKATAKSLGLAKIGDCIVHKDDAVLAGKVKILAHLVTVEAVENA